MGAAVFILSATYAHDGIRLHAVPKARNLNNPILRPSGRSSRRWSVPTPAAPPATSWLG